MAFNVLRLAMEEGVRRVVITSSNHAADWYETKLHDGRLDMVGPDSYPLSDNFYGWAKATYEHLGFLFAAGRLGRVLENVQVRVGAPRPIVAGDFHGDETSYKRNLGAYISERDMQQLYTKSIEAEDIRNADGIPFQIFYGVSNNTRAFWSIANARSVIGYAPEDDSEQVFAKDIRHCIGTNGRTS
jgi:uronate dehydrogenase/NAD+ dependent glucose-6-phosphate dehydrogenase